MIPKNLKNNNYISLHGGHSGQFCNHAQDFLEEMVLRYIELGFTTIGITEHIPPLNDQNRYQDEIDDNLSTLFLQKRFADYIKHARWLQKKYQDKITILVAFETEYYTGVIPFIQKLQKKYKPDYILGSIHHVDDINFDYSLAEYELVVAHCGNIDNLYIRYFDQQYELLNKLKPEVVAHFDLIRIFDPDYYYRLQIPKIRKLIIRNLELIKQQEGILDYNTRALLKGGLEPYPSDSIVKIALEMDIKIITGDDSHNIASVGEGIKSATTRLQTFLK